MPGLPPPSGEIAQRLKDLRDSRERRQAEVEAITAKRAMIQNFGQQAPTIISGKDEAVEPEQWEKAWRVVGRGLLEAGKNCGRPHARLRRSMRRSPASRGRRRAASVQASPAPPMWRSRPLMRARCACG